MKALKTPLAKKVLADPKGKVQLRTYLETKSGRSTYSGKIPVATVQIRSDDGRLFFVRPHVVAKAA